MPNEIKKTRWQDLVKPYKQPHLGRSIWQLTNTLIPYFCIWGLMIYSLDHSYWMSLGLGVINGLLTIRLFIINHDCGHGSFFNSKRANSIVGFWTGALSFTPYAQWRYGHWVHHSKSGQYEDKGVGYFWIMGVEEYKNASMGVRAFYRFYRNPFVLFLLGGMYQFIIEHRLTLSSINWEQKRSVYLTNLLWAGIIFGMGSWIGYWNFFILMAPVVFTGSFWGLWLFYVQHHYEGSYWSHRKNWKFEKAALQGSSYLKLDPITEWFAGAINYHHIHHLVPLIPNYRLKEAHNNIPMFKAIKPLTLKQILGSWKLRLVDEKTCEWENFPKSAS